MQSIKKSLILKFSILQVTYWCSNGAFTGYVLAYLQSERGFSDSLAGTVLTVATAMAFLGSMFWSRICDKWRTHQKVFILTNVLMFLLAICVYFSTNKFAVIALYSLQLFTQSPVPANLDTWIIKSFTAKPTLYGPVRSAASFFYSIFMFCFGLVLEKLGYHMMLITMGALVACSVTVASLTPDAFVAEKENDTEKSGRKDSLFTSSFCLLLFILLCTGVAGTLYQLIPIVMNNINAPLSLMGTAMFIGAFCQVPFMLFNTFFSKIPARVRLLLGGLFYMIALVAAAFIRTPWVLAIFISFNGMGYGILMPTIRELTYESAAPALRTTAVGVADAVYVSMAGIVSGGCVSLLSNPIGVPGIMLVLTGIQIAGLVPVFILLVRGRVQKA